MNTTPHALIIDDLVIPVRIDPEHEYTVSTAEAASGYGVSKDTLKKTVRRHRRELIEGKHWFAEVGTNCPHPHNGVTGVTNCHAGQRRGNEPITRWTKRGLIRLGFFIKSERARRFRDMAEDLIIRTLEAEPTPAEPAPPLNVLGEVEHRIREFPITCKRHVGAYEALLFLHARITSGALTAPVKPSRIYEGFLLWLRCIGEMQAAQGRRSAIYTNREIAAMNPPGSPAATSRHLAQIEGQPVKIDAAHILTVLPTRSRHTRGWEFRLEKTNGLALVP